MIKRVATTNFALFTGAGPHTYSHVGGTCNVAIVYIYQAFDNGIASVTYGGVAMTRLAKFLNANNHDHTIWGLLNPPVGTQTVSITTSHGSVITGATTYVSASGAATFPDVANSGGSSPTTSVTVSVTTTKDNCILVGMGGYVGNGISAVSAGTNTNQFQTYQVGGLSVGMEESSPLSTGTAGSKSLQVISGNNADMSLVVAGIAPSLSKSNFFRLL